MSKERDVLVKCAKELFESGRFTNTELLFILKTTNWQILKFPLGTDTLEAIIIEVTTK